MEARAEKEKKKPPSCEGGRFSSSSEKHFSALSIHSLLTELNYIRSNLVPPTVSPLQDRRTICIKGRTRDCNPIFFHSNSCTMSRKLKKMLCKKKVQKSGARQYQSGNVKFSDSKTNGWESYEAGYLLAASLGSRANGVHLHFMFLDKPHKQMDSNAQHQSQNQIIIIWSHNFGQYQLPLRIRPKCPASMSNLRPLNDPSCQIVKKYMDSDV